MNKRDLIIEIKKEIEQEKNDFIKEEIRERIIELEMARRTVAKLEASFEKYLDSDDSEDLIYEL